MKTAQSRSLLRQHGTGSKGLLIATSVAAVALGGLCLALAWSQPKKPAAVPHEPIAYAYPAGSAPVLSRPTPLELSFSSRFKGTDLVIEGKTNLPDGTNLMVTSQSGNGAVRRRMATSVVQAGRFVVSFSLGSDVPARPATYDITVTGLDTRLQPAPVQPFLGDNYSRFSSPYIRPFYDEGEFICNYIETHLQVRVR
jgi:hypothetical protein